MKSTLTRRNFAVAFLCLSLFVVSCSKPTTRDQASISSPTPTETPKAYPSPSPKLSANGKLRQYIPQANWVKLFFEGINKRAKQSGLSDLKSFSLTGNDLELRVWDGFGQTGLGGFVLKRTNNQWSALRLRPMHENETSNPTQPFSEPSYGFEEFWNKLIQLGILTLPDSYYFEDYIYPKDGFGYVVEINMNGIYRTYCYPNPDTQTPEYGNSDPHSNAAAKQMLKIACLIFGQSCEKQK